VLAPETLGQLPLSYLVPAVDGTYLGAGVGAAGDLVNLVVTAEEPASPFGPMWPAGGGGGLDFANAANPPSGVKLLGADAAARAEEVWMFQDALALDKKVPASAADHLWDNGGFLDIRGISINEFKALGPIVNPTRPPNDYEPFATSIANDIGNLVKPAQGRRVVEFGLTSDDLAFWSGGKTFDAGEERSRTAVRKNSGLGINNPQILINLPQVYLNNRDLVFGSWKGSRFLGQTVEYHPDYWTVRDFVWKPPGDTRIHAPIVLWHELGHAWGVRRGASIRAGETNPDAIRWENLARIMRYEALGRTNAPRIRE
jgi:hypothetical protein